MIKTIFLPEKIGSYYLLAKRIVGIEITAQYIYASVALISGKKRILEKTLMESLVSKELQEGSLDDRIIFALKNLAPKLGTYDELRCVLPSSLVIFKDMTLPFTGLNKIKLVVPFEVEPLLPFTLDQAILDCIVTEQDTKNGHTDIVVAAVKMDTIAPYTKYFETAGLKLTTLTVDIFELYGLYRSTLKESDAKKTVTLVHVEAHKTLLAVITQGKLTYIRSLAKGLPAFPDAPEQTYSASVTHLLNEQPQTTADHLRMGLQELLDDITVSVQSYVQKARIVDLPTQIVITGLLADIPGIEKYTPPSTNEVHFLTAQNLFKAIESKSTVPGSFVISAAAATAQELTYDFTLLQEEAQKKQNTLISRQLLISAALALSLFICFSLYSFLRVRTLRFAVRAAEAEAITELKKNFKLKQGQTVNLTAGLKAAGVELKKQETAWSHLSSENRYAYLRILTELSRCINSKDSQLDLITLYIKDDTVKLYGSVPGYQQLTKLQAQLECPLFKKLPKLQNWDFKSEPITVVVNREEL